MQLKPCDLPQVDFVKKYKALLVKALTKTIF